MPPPALLRIGLLLYPACMPAGLFAFADLVHASNRRAGSHLFEPVFVAATPGVVECAHGQMLTASDTLLGSNLDAVLVPGFWAESPQHISNTLSANANLTAALAAMPKKLMMWSYCTGVCIIAAAGKLDGQHATVTWWLLDLMRQRYPKVVWQGERTSVFNVRNATASGVNGYLPIAQALIESRLSLEAYRDLTKLMVLPRPERTHHAFQTMNLMEQPDRLLRKLYAIAERLPAAEATVARLAAELNMTERTLARKVLASAGLPLASYVRRIKLNQVSERLILTSMPAKTISDELGFSSDSGMRRMFKELTSLTPAEYRQQFARR